MRSYSDLPLDIIENIIGRLRLIDRIRIRGVCKDWSVLSCEIPSVDKYPWAMTSFWWYPYPYPYNDVIYVECKLSDPPVSKQYAVEGALRGKEFFGSAWPRASSYGWLLFEHNNFSSSVMFLYCPFTREVINLPELKKYIPGATFSLDATSPKCVIFTLGYSRGKKIRINICCPGDKSWKTFKFMSGFEKYNNPPVEAAYGNGIFYCVSTRGELGAFNVGLGEWTVLSNLKGVPSFEFDFVNLIASDGNLQLIGWRHTFSEENYLKILKFDFSEKHWVEERNLEDRVLFTGCTSFSCPALGVGEISELANHVLPCGDKAIRYGGSTSSSNSQHYHNWVETARNAKAWIEVPIRRLWTANDLINAALL
ncbi:hypothetical protein COLO4_35200 [Corchorus olitorius]|uniref:F-box domain-containing protein n=1 Tax=Corchorus olitorius TaxID=93759 RepID=A0A1R3GHY0_9ROSI|nr:hypothetical protein COLO4_35200 [Corchorus olitorius]